MDILTDSYSRLLEVDLEAKIQLEKEGCEFDSLLAGPEWGMWRDLARNSETTHISYLSSNGPSSASISILEYDDLSANHPMSLMRWKFYKKMCINIKITCWYTVNAYNMIFIPFQCKLTTFYVAGVLHILCWVNLITGRASLIWTWLIRSST